MLRPGHLDCEYEMRMRDASEQTTERCAPIGPKLCRSCRPRSLSKLHNKTQQRPPGLFAI